ncbi:extracellular solute-binding protein [Trujillonella endophytica]|uniref:Multiple sugar transport system substrate-binding protein n=1 Tax=Trujillonella endophytica TaxID=673521 RepID=A0A1H8VGG3_9ACTN|nr:extracellular solute-binding protein [Trujillella endophytica]SEP14495.1 multiple sugar transport system substrate-binding protein [Trujillella endophytica]
MPDRRRRGLGGGAAAIVLASTLAGCGSDESGPPTLTWYINPDSGGQASIAEACTDDAGGRYTIDTEVLPRDAAGQREQLIRRLAAEDSSIDIMSLDPPFVPEFAEAGFLAPVPEDLQERTTGGVVQGAVDGATWNDEIVAVPFWANTQVLWYRLSVVEAAGLDMTQPVTWEQIVEVAEEQGVLIGAQGARAESLTVWVNALIESAGGHIIEQNADAPEDIELGLDTEAGQRAAEVMRLVADSDAAGAAFSTENEDASATGFEGDNGGFQVNYPFVYPRAVETVGQELADDYGAAVYPRVDADTPAAPPLGGIDLGVGAYSENVDIAFEAVECIRSEENQIAYFISDGNPASLASAFDDPEVLDKFPMAPVIRESLELAAPRPQSPYYSEITGGIQASYHSPASVGPQTAADATEFITAVLAGEQLL